MHFLLQKFLELEDDKTRQSVNAEERKKERGRKKEREKEREGERKRERKKYSSSLKRTENSNLTVKIF